MALISEEEKKALKEKFEREMKDKIDLIAVLGGEEEKKDFEEFTKELVKELGELTDKINVEIVEGLDSEVAKKHNVISAPTVLIHPEKYNIRYTGAPAGEEGWGFVETIVRASKGESGLSEASKKELKKVKDKKHIQVFVTPSCPYCPQAVLTANILAIEVPDRVSAECVEAYENPELANKFSVSSVPLAVINESLENTILGARPEADFVASLLK